MTALLGPAEIRHLAAELGIRPTKTLGQNFVHDPNTVRRIVRAAALTPDDVVVEVGPGLGSLTLGLLPEVAHTHAVEIDPVLAAQLPVTVASHTAPDVADRLTVHALDALRVTSLTPAPTALVANLPYNVAVPVVLHLLATLPSLRSGLVMVQKEVADRLVAPPGSRTYGVPSVKLAWYAQARLAGRVPPSVFWPVPNVDSGLVFFSCRVPPSGDRNEVFAVVDAAFAQRRKMLRSALAPWAGSPDAAASILAAAAVPATARGEELTVEQFAAIATAGRDLTGGTYRRDDPTMSEGASMVENMTAQALPARSLWTPDPVRQRLADYTIEDVLALPDDAPRVELRDGVLIVVPSPTLGHQNIGNFLWMWLYHNAPPEFVASTALGVAIDLKNTLEPDVVLLRQPVMADRHFFTLSQVALAVEVVSPGTRRRDRFEKPGEYARAGVPYFWRIEQNPTHIYAYALARDGQYRLVADSDKELVLDAPFEIRLPIRDITP